MGTKTAYICGPLTELPEHEQAETKAFYSSLGDVVEKATGTRAFVPHEHYDPVNFPHFTPGQIDDAERARVRDHTDMLVVVALAPSWGGGIEVEIANTAHVPSVILCEKEKLEAKKISRLLLGNPSVTGCLPFRDRDHARALLLAVFTMRTKAHQASS